MFKKLTLITTLLATMLLFGITSQASEWYKTPNGGWIIYLENDGINLASEPYEENIDHYYSDINISKEDKELLARMSRFEYRDGTLADKVLTIEVTLNRVKSPIYPNSVREVLSQKNQYATWYDIKNSTANAEDLDYEAVEYVLRNGCTELPKLLASYGLDHDATHYVFFDRKGKNGKWHIRKNAHVFGYKEWK